VEKLLAIVQIACSLITAGSMVFVVIANRRCAESLQERENRIEIVLTDLPHSDVEGGQ
jgi:hypothetical protein